MPSPGDFPNSGIKLASPALQVDSLPAELPGKPKKWKSKSFSPVWLFSTLWTVAHQAPLSMAFSQQEYWNGLPCPPPWDFPNLGIEPRSPPLQADSLPSEPSGKPRILEWVAYAFSWGSAWPRNQTEFFCIAGEFFIREVPFSKSPYFKRTIEE